MASDAPVLRLRELLGSLADTDLEFLVFGAVAAALYGHVRATADLDIVIRPTPENRERMLAWLAAHDARLGNDPNVPFGQRHQRALHLGRNAFVVTEYGQLDVVQHISGLPGWETLSTRAERFDLDGLTVLAVDRQTLIDRKRARGLTLDLADVEALEALDHQPPPAA